MDNNLINNNLHLTSINASSRNTTINSTGSSTTNPSHLKSVDEGTQSALFQKFRGFVSKHKVLTSVAKVFFGLVALGLFASGIGAMISGAAAGIILTTWVVAFAINKTALFVAILVSVSFVGFSCAFVYGLNQINQDALDSGSPKNSLSLRYTDTIKQKPSEGHTYNEPKKVTVDRDGKDFVNREFRNEYEYEYCVDVEVTTKSGSSFVVPMPRIVGVARTPAY